jgi:endonuclease IV
MSKTTPATILAAILIVTALALAQKAQELPHAPYLTDVAQAQAKAAEKGQDVLVYFHSDT